LNSRPISQQRREEVYQVFLASYHASNTQRQRLYEIDEQLFNKMISHVNFVRVRTEEEPFRLSCAAIQARNQVMGITMDNFAAGADRLLEERKELVKELIRIDRSLDEERPRSKEFVSI
jgi:hypothetical protein